MIGEFMNEIPEVHATVHGIYAGLAEWKGTELPQNEDIQAEPHYFKGGYIIGTLMRWCAIVIIGKEMFGI